MIKKITEVGRRWFSPTTIRRIGAFMLMASMALGTATVAFADDDDDDDDWKEWRHEQHKRHKKHKKHMKKLYKERRKARKQYEKDREKALRRMVRHAARGGRDVDVWQISDDTYIVRYNRGGHYYTQRLYPYSGKYGRVNSISVNWSPESAWSLIPGISLNFNF